MSSVHDIVLPALESHGRLGEMAIGGFITLIDTLKELKLVDPAAFKRYVKTLSELVAGSIEHDISKWKLYGVRPSKYIHSPESIFYEENRGIVDEELDFFIDNLLNGSVWPITWSWFDNNTIYHKEFDISENWWKSKMACDILYHLQNFGRIKS